MGLPWKIHSFSLPLPKSPRASIALRATWSNGQAGRCRRQKDFISQLKAKRLIIFFYPSIPVQDYQNFLSSGKQELELTVDTPSVFLVGDLTADDAKYIHIVKALMALGNEDMVVPPGQPLPETMGGAEQYPIYVTMPPKQLGYFLDHLPDTFKERVDDFIFFSGGLEYGNIEDVLKERGMSLTWLDVACDQPDDLSYH